MTIQCKQKSVLTCQTNSLTFESKQSIVIITLNHQNTQHQGMLVRPIWLVVITRLPVGNNLLPKLQPQMNLIVLYMI